MDNLRVCLFVSRNKDNKDVENFEQRKMSFLTNKTERELMDDFLKFAWSGVAGEKSRFYISVNKRDPERVRRDLQKFLIDYPDTDLTKIESKVASVASRNENRMERFFLLDCDTKDHQEYDRICEYLTENKDVMIRESYRTPNGWGVITRGFDTREILEKFPCISLHRDGEKFVKQFILPNIDHGSEWEDDDE